MTNIIPTTTTIGADAALARLVAAVEAETDPGWDCNSYHPSLWSALDVARAALASAAQPASAQADTSLLLSFAPHFNGCETPETSLSAIIYRYFRAHFEDRSEADALAHDYIRALASAAQPVAVPAAAVGLGDDLVTYESAMQAIEHVAIHNSASREREAVDMLVAAPAAQAAPAAVAVPVKWWNGCDVVVPAALRYLADNERPSGGEERFNCAHLYQLAGEIERMARLPLYTAPVPAAQGAGHA